MTRFVKIIFPGLLLSTSYSFAAGECAKLHIEISNATHETCQLVNQQVVHGMLIDGQPAPGVLLEGWHKSFNMTQSLLGPKVTLTYQCGSGEVTFTSGQGLCLGWAGTAYGATISEKGVKASVLTIVQPSILPYFSSHGTVQWIISDDK